MQNFADFTAKNLPSMSREGMNAIRALCTAEPQNGRLTRELLLVAQFAGAAKKEGRWVFLSLSRDVPATEGLDAYQEHFLFMRLLHSSDGWTPICGYADSGHKVDVTEPDALVELGKPILKKEEVQYLNRRNAIRWTIGLAFLAFVLVGGFQTWANANIYWNLGLTLGSTALTAFITWRWKRNPHAEF